MKKFIVTSLLTLIFFINFNVYTTSAEAVPTLEAEGVVLMDGTTGEIIYSKNPNTKYEPASTTKVMTALITLENCKLDDKVTIGSNPPEVDGTIIGVAKGEVYTVKELLLGLLLESGNDAAEALAEHISGSNEAFGKLMTKKAKELGANNTVFKNPSGLHEEGHVTTAYDLSLIMKTAYNNKDFLEISRTPYYIFKNNPNFDGSEKWANNKNHCINPNSPYYYEYAVSGKTGYTPEANHTYTSVAKKGDQVLIASFLNATDKDTQFRNVGELFQYGFDNFQTTKIVSKGEKLSEYKINDNITIPLLATTDVYFTQSKSDPKPIVSVTYENRDISKKTINKGDLLFNSSILVNNKDFAKIDLSSGIDRDYSFKVKVSEYLQKLKEDKPKLLIASFTFLIIILFLLFILKIIKKKRQRK
ncbi:D-alanyl-D-alanine carboxypeptidase family protein [Clostridium septicum]|uniref:serine-type D-Ala-D-Ala carboxypeptidase n=1 Tax=Clostridium septicum TaxID=1504 RepID=A0A9N7JLV6_CLOSE|nr:D-alanyl-D-alanine carboxypeptidase family protein [Clostridium septicum]AYE34833.1 D-alanyl-D-alanine carboxypeptidase [Clostridium septicum]MDU1313351.1 D-alanyl-D-alanine carboxypeptidase family protein [Clostridium septicum]UEC20518.1 D-alanyl-D-alanine carboxypeptidase [Clostridium septicum]USS01427.1 D-alanyl-D-alanine carboxypeptidase [Clostridium septicum]WLF69989.1 D-alanyl-D-alanine carboxypeptidase family protein [Clostridium septicum]